MMRFLVEKGAKINALNDEGKTALDLARFYGESDVAESLECLGGV